MNISLRSADQATHIKIVMVSLVAAILVAAVGISTRNFDIDESTPVAAKAGKPVNFSTKDVPMVR